MAGISQVCLVVKFPQKWPFLLPLTRKLWRLGPSCDDGMMLLMNRSGYLSALVVLNTDVPGSGS